MSRARRARLTVEVPGNPALYLPPAGMPPGWEIIGTVTDADGAGALVRNTRTGIYCKANGGAVRSLPQRKVITALAGAEDGA